MTPRKSKKIHGAAKSDRMGELRRIEREEAHMWIELVGLGIATMLVLAGAVFCLLRLATFSYWSWPQADVTLLGGLAVASCAFALYASHRGRRLRARRGTLVEGEHLSLTHFEKYYDQLLELNKVSRTMASKTSPQSLFNRITQICFDTFDCERVSIMAVDPEKHELTVRSAVGHGDMDLVLGSRQGVGDGVAGWVAEHRRPLLLGPQINPEKFWRFRPNAESIYSAMVVPILFRDRLYGVICVSSRNSQVSYTQEDMRILEVMAWNAAVCIRHVELLGEHLGSVESSVQAEEEPETERKTA